MTTRITITILFSLALLQFHAQAQQQVPGPLGGVPMSAQGTGILPGAAQAPSPGPAPGSVVKDITQYGVVAGACISQALLAAWKEAIESPVPTSIVIPPGNWTLYQVKLEGPSKAPIELVIQGNVDGPTDPQGLPNPEGEWIAIQYLSYFTLTGGGTLDGKGHVAWSQNDCHKNNMCAQSPMNLAFHAMNHSIIRDITSKDSKNFHVNIIGSYNVTFLRFHVCAPGDSRNTDGIHMGRSSNINIIDSIIETGDDCISIGDETCEVNITGVTCGPGHGISIGSLGKYENEKDVKGIYVKNCTLKGTTNGIRIKSWPAAKSTLTVSNICVEDVVMDNVSNPIIIDQEYCPWNLCDKTVPSLVQITQVSMKNIRGTSASAEAVILACSSTKPCTGVEIGDIDLQYTGNKGPITTKCSNIQPILVGKQNPPLCVQPAAA